MDDRTIELIGGVLLFSGAAIALLASLMPDGGLPAATYILIGIGLFGGVFLIGLSYSNRTI